MVTAAAVDPLQAAVDDTAAQLREQLSRLEGLEAERDSVAQELAAMEGRSGEDMLDDPAAGMRLVEEIPRARVRLEVLNKTINAQSGRVAAARAAYLSAEGDAIEPEVDAARERLAEHQHKVRQLLSDLEDLEGEFVPRHQYLDALRSADTLPVGTQWRVPRSEQLTLDVTRATVRLEVLRVMAAGGDPARVTHPIVQADVWGSGLSMADLYPACLWRPGALVRAPVLTDREAAARRWVAELEGLVESLPEEIARLRRTLPSTPHTVGTDPTAEARIMRLQARLDQLPAELDAARGDLNGARAA